MYTASQIMTISGRNIRIARKKQKRSSSQSYASLQFALI
jgi:hypothetical protein